MNNPNDPHLCKLIIELLGYEWFNLLDVRNAAPYGSSKYDRAVSKMEKIENKASMMVFGDTTHTMTECLNGKEDDR